jgi:uncharacterized protein (DUF433 family)
LIYRHFPSREELLKAVFQAGTEKLAKAGQEFADTLPPVEALRAWMMMFVDFIADWSGQGPTARLEGNCRSFTRETMRMVEAIKTEHPHIVRLDGVCGGEPVIEGLRVAVRHVVTLHRRGESILEIAEALGITEAQVFHALSYFFDHRDEILALIAEEELAHERFRGR